jgi:transposase
MPRYKPQAHNSLLLPVVLSEQIVPGSFAFALNYLVDNELDLRPLDAQFNNDEVGASAYDPRVMLKIVLLAYSQGLISSRAIEQACQRNVQFIAISSDSQPSHTHIAKFVANLGVQIKPLLRVWRCTKPKTSAAQTRGWRPSAKPASKPCVRRQRAPNHRRRGCDWLRLRAGHALAHDGAKSSLRYPTDTHHLRCGIPQ